MMRRHRAGWQGVLGVACLALVFSACGGGDGGPSTMTLTITPSPAPAGFLPLPDRRPTLPNPARQPVDMPTPTIVAPGTVLFDHPDGELRWDGPDGRVHSEYDSHCTDYQAQDQFGVPGLIAIEEERWFWLARPLPQEDGWRWTGYSHGDWQILQGDNARIVYLVNADEAGIAFEYRATACF